MARCFVAAASRISSRKPRTASAGVGRSSGAARSQAHTTYSRRRGGCGRPASAACTSAAVARWSGCGSRRQGTSTVAACCCSRNSLQPGRGLGKPRLAGGSGHLAVGQAQQQRLGCISAQHGEGVAKLGFPHGLPGRRPKTAAELGCDMRAVAHQHGGRGLAGLVQQGQQPAAAQRLIVGVRGNDYGRAQAGHEAGRRAPGSRKKEARWKQPDSRQRKTSY